MIERQVGAHKVREHARLEVGDDALADLVHQHRLAVVGEALDGEDGDHDQRQSHEHVAVLVGEHLVEHRLHHIGVRRGRRGDDNHARRGERETADMGPHLVAHEAVQ